MIGAKIIDFKFAVFEGLEPVYYEAGTPGFIAPECCAVKEGHIPDVKEDVFSLGAVMYSMLCGEYLFHA